MADVNADRRVPTAADVERWGRWWWLVFHGESPGLVELFVADGEVNMRDIDDEGLEETYPIAWLANRTWLGPVNPEPLPWPEGDD